MSRRDVVFWFPTVEPAFVARLNALADRGNIDFECWYTRTRQPDRLWQISLDDLRFPFRFVRALNLGSAGTGIPVQEWRRAAPEVLVTQVGQSATGAALLQRLRPHGKLLFIVEKTIEPVFRRTRAKEALKHVMFRCADGLLTPGADADRYFASYTRRATPFHRLVPSIDGAFFSSAIPMRADPATDARREALGLHGLVFLYVGRISAMKGIDTLIRAYAELEHAGMDVSLLLVGDDVERDRFREQVRSLGIRRVVFLDFVQRAELPGIYALGDAFVFPTRGDSYGLVVDEAMAAGLPVIASTSTAEIADRIGSPEVGSLVPRDDMEALRDAMIGFHERRADLPAMGCAATRAVADHSPESWAIQMEDILARARRRS